MSATQKNYKIVPPVLHPFLLTLLVMCGDSVPPTLFAAQHWDLAVADSVFLIGSLKFFVVPWLTWCYPLIIEPFHFSISVSSLILQGSYYKSPLQALPIVLRYS